MRRLNSIELCRGIAAVMVVTLHCDHIFSGPKNFGMQPVGAWLGFGRSGVDFFFVLSGFLISRIHWNDIGFSARLRHYAIRRVTRIYPTYWLVLAVLIPIDIFSHTLFDHYDKPIEVLKAIFLIPQNATILNVNWSLQNELLFYSIFGAAIFNRRLGIALVSIWVCILAAGPMFPASLSSRWVDLIIFPMNFEFLAGVAAGVFFERFKIRHPRALVMFGMLCFVALWIGEDFVWPGLLTLSQLMVRCFGYGIAGVSVVMGLSALELKGLLTVPRPFITLGGASYLLYLVHVPALVVLAMLERHIHLIQFLPGWFVELAFDAVIVLAAVAIHLKIEKPILRKIRR